MDKIEFDQRYKLINAVKQEINSLDIESKLDVTKNSVDTVLNNIKDREEKINYYINALNEFSYSNNLTVPSDLFPGLRVASDLADPEELQQKADLMKSSATAIKTINTLINPQISKAYSNLKELTSLYSEIISRYNQLYELEMSLVADMDSIYDIGDIARNT